MHRLLDMDQSGEKRQVVNSTLLGATNLYLFTTREEFFWFVVSYRLLLSLLLFASMQTV